MKIEESGIKVEDLQINNPDETDAWAINEFNNTVSVKSRHLEIYRLNDAAKIIYDFFWHTYCDWYIEIAKDNFTAARAKVAVYLLINSMKLLHPFMPFITEEVLAIISAHCGLKLEDSLVRAAWPKMHPLKINAESLENFCALLESIKELRNIKADLGIAQKKVKLEIQASSYVGNLWTAHQAWIKRLGFFESIELKKQLKRVLYKNDLWEINLDIADID